MSKLRRWSQLLLVVLAISPAVWAAPKPKVRVFDASPDRVFQAALKAAREHYTISYEDEKNLFFTFHAVPTWTMQAYQVTVSVEPTGDGKSKLTLNIQFDAFVIGDHTANPAKKFSGYVSENLANQPAKQ